MSDDKNDGNPSGSGPPPPPEIAPGVSGEQAEVSMLITVKGNQLAVNGPLHDTIFCYGMLERAKDLVRKMQDERAKKGPPGMTPGGLVIPSMGFKPPGRPG